jgi:hypothetical protein
MGVALSKPVGWKVFATGEDGLAARKLFFGLIA